ncbi:MAG: PaaI family thioesterase [Tetrasphaera sp.]|nr:PaaI family thioesterase [Tetrasphaera sp.]
MSGTPPDDGTAGVHPASPVLLTAVPDNEGVDAAVAATRRLIAALLHAGNSTAAELNPIAHQLNAIASYLEEHCPPVEDRLVDMWSDLEVTRHDPASGPENAIAPPLEMSGNPDGSVSGVVTLGLPYQGPPGYVHGGISALLLDHAFGMANHWAGKAGMTGTLTMRYRRPVPLFTELEVRAKNVGGEGRKLFVEGTISIGGEVCIEADAIFISRFVDVPGHASGAVPGGHSLENPRG